MTRTLEDHAKPHPRWKGPDEAGRHPGTIDEWDYRNDAAPGAAARSERRLNVAADYDDPRAPDQMALVLRIDLSRIKSELIHKRAFFEAFRDKVALDCDTLRDAQRYRRLQILGCAVMDTPQLEAGTVVRFTGLDEIVDADLKTNPSRGEATVGLG